MKSVKILIIGTGVIGSTYGWQLSESGNQITHFVRSGQKENLENNGLLIRCLDARKQGTPLIEKRYSPNFTEQLNDTYELIIVPVKANQLKSILPLLARVNQKTDILFLQNIWISHLNEIEKFLPDSQVIYGQAHIMGGGKSGNTITCTIFNNKNAPTMLGKKDGTETEQVKKTAQLMRQAGLNPLISRNIVGWLLTHYVEASGLVAGVMEAGSAQNYVSDSIYIKHSVKLIREGFKVCSLLNIHAWKIYPQVMYYSPMWFEPFPIFRRQRSSAIG